MEGFPCPVKTFHSVLYDAINPTKPSISAAGKVVVVTGGGTGIGRAIARAFARAGSSKIAILGRTEANLESTRREIEEGHAGHTVLPVVTDIVDTAAVASAFEQIRSTFGPIEILVHNAGFMNTLSLLADADLDDWWQCYEVNVKGSMNVIKALLSAGIASPRARVVNVSTASAHAIVSGQTPYASSKLAAAKLFEVLQVEHPEMQVLSVHPGTVLTDMGLKPTKAGQDLGALPWDDVELSAGFVVWAASPEAQFLKGRFVWANWDVEELKAQEEEVSRTEKFTLGLYGFPRLVIHSWSPAQKTG